MITALVLVLAQATAATPAPSPVSTPAASPAPAKLSGGFGQKPAAPGKARVVLTDHTLAPRSKAGTFSVAGARSTPAPAPTEGREPREASPAPDAETRWKTRVSALRANLAEAEKELKAADDANTVVAFGELGHEYHMLMAMRNAALAPYRAKVASLRDELAGLPEECRRAPDCQPGWVR